MTITTLMASNNISPDTDLTVMDNAIRLHNANEAFGHARLSHFLNHREWLPSYFEKEAEAFFGFRYTQDEIQQFLMGAYDHLNPNWQEEADAEFERLTDDEKQEIEELADDLINFLDERLTQRDKDNSVLAELAKELE